MVLISFFIVFSIAGVEVKLNFKSRCGLDLYINAV
jgi:hypothetical protein